MRSLKYKIDLAPLAWKRCMIDSRGGNPKFFDGQAKDKVIFGLTIVKQHGNANRFSVPIHMDIVFYMPLPKTNKKYKADEPFVGKSDLDNLVKFLLDTLVDADILSDDNIVWSITCKKVYSKLPRSEFTITETSPQDFPQAILK